VKNLKVQLQQSLKDASKIVIMGIGSELIGDDAAGVLVVQKLEKQIKSKNVLVLNCCTSPENFTGIVKDFKPTDIIIVDSADFNEHPGFTRIIAHDEINGVSFSTHRLPTKIMIDYLIQSLSCRIIVIGIQPKHLVYGEKPSSEVLDAVSALAKDIKESIVI